MTTVTKVLKRKSPETIKKHEHSTLEDNLKEIDQEIEFNFLTKIQ
jgi:hypothetical protein